MPLYVVVMNPYGEIGNLDEYGPVLVVDAKTQAEAKRKVKREAGPPVSIDALDAWRAHIINPTRRR